MMSDSTRSKGASAFSEKRKVDLDEARRRREAKQRGRPQEQDADEQEEHHDPVREALRLRLNDPTCTVEYFLDNEAPPREWLVDRLIPKLEPGVLFGQGGAGKGHAQIRLGINYAIGWNFGPFQIPKPGRMMIVSFEESKEELHRRVRDAVLVRDTMLDTHDKEWRDRLVHGLILVSLRGVNVKLGDKSFVEALGEKIASVSGVDLVTLDPLLKIVPGGMDINNQADAGTINNMVGELVEVLGASVAPVHHASKAGASTEPGKDMGIAAMSGSHAIADLARWSLRFAKASKKDISDYQLDPSGRYLAITGPKANYSDISDAPEPFFWRRRNGGALEYCTLASRSEREAKLDERVLAILPDTGATDGEWEKACGNLQPKIPRDPYRDAKARLIADGCVRVVEEKSDPPRRGRATQRFMRV